MIDINSSLLSAEKGNRFLREAKNIKYGVIIEKLKSSEVAERL